MDNIYTALALVEAGLGISLFPASIQDLRRRGVVFRELEAPFPKMECAVVRRREAQPPVLHSFLNVVRQVSARPRSLKPAAMAAARSATI